MGLLGQELTISQSSPYEYPRLTDQVYPPALDYQDDPRRQPDYSIACLLPGETMVTKKDNVEFVTSRNLESHEFSDSHSHLQSLENGLVYQNNNTEDCHDISPSSLEISAFHNLNIPNIHHSSLASYSTDNWLYESSQLAPTISGEATSTHTEDDDNGESLSHSFRQREKVLGSPYDARHHHHSYLEACQGLAASFDHRSKLNLGIESHQIPPCPCQNIPISRLQHPYEPTCPVHLYQTTTQNMSLSTFSNSNDDVTTHTNPPGSSKSHRDARDRFLISSKLSGMSYKEIKSRGRFKEAESTLRGRFRTLTKAPEQRLRKPVWSPHDVSSSISCSPHPRYTFDHKSCTTHLTTLNPIF